MVCLGLEPRMAGFKVQTNPLELWWHLAQLSLIIPTLLSTYYGVTNAHGPLSQPTGGLHHTVFQLSQELFDLDFMICFHLRFLYPWVLLLTLVQKKRIITVRIPTLATEQTLINLQIIASLFKQQYNCAAIKCQQFHQSNIECKDRGGGQVVSVLAFYSDDPSSNPAEAYSFSVNFVFEKNQNKQKEGGVGHFFKKILSAWI